MIITIGFDHITKYKIKCHTKSSNERNIRKLLRSTKSSNDDSLMIPINSIFFNLFASLFFSFTIIALPQHISFLYCFKKKNLKYQKTINFRAEFFKKNFIFKRNKSVVSVIFPHICFFRRQIKILLHKINFSNDLHGHVK